MKRIIWITLALIGFILFGVGLMHAQGPVAAYGFNENTGTTVSDASGNNNTGNVGTATWTTGKYGNALSFNGTNAKVTIANSATLQLTNAMTLEVWVNPSTLGNVWRDIIYKGNDNYYLEGSSDNGSKFAVGGTFSAGPLYSSSILPVNTWTHLAATYDKVTLRLYVNAVQVASKPQTATLLTSTNPLQIGGDTFFNQYFQGIIDEVRIYNRALSLAEIQTDMNTPIGAVVPPADTTPPVISSGQPTGVLASGTTSAVLSVVTNENASCRYSTTVGQSYAAMPNAFTVTGMTAHTSNLTGLVDGSNYNYYVKCSDPSSNISGDYNITFSVATIVILPPTTTDVHPDDPITIGWDYTTGASINGFGLYAGATATGPWVFYNGITNTAARTVSFIAPDKDTFFAMNACKQDSATTGTCSVMSIPIKIHCIPLSEQFLWQTFTTRQCQ